MFYNNSHLRLLHEMLLILSKEMQMPGGNVIGFEVSIFFFFCLLFLFHLGLIMISALLNILKFLLDSSKAQSE